VESKAHFLVEFIQVVLLVQITQTLVDRVDHQVLELLNFTQVEEAVEHRPLGLMEFQHHRAALVAQVF
jgi:hypothetical protein